MNTTQKLWLGFGTLMGLLIFVCVAISLRVASIETGVREMAEARNLSSASEQLETTAMAYALNVRAYLQTGEAEALRQVGNKAAELERHLKTYERLEITDRRRDLAARFAPQWQELKTLGDALVDPDGTQLRLNQSVRFFELRTRLEKLLHEEMQVDALVTYNQRKDEALADVRDIRNFALILLVIGLLTGVGTSVAVGRALLRSHDALRESREMLRVTLASIGDAVITTDEDGRVTYLNAVAESLTGWASENAAGRPLDEVFHIVHEGSREPAENPATKALREGGIVGMANHTTLIARDGSERPIDDSAAPIRDERGNISGVVLIFRDVTERNLAESRLRQNAAELSDADARKNEFIAMLAHELRNPLAPISNALQVLRMGAGSAAPTAAMTAMMERQVGQMVRLVDDLLDVSRISRGKIELRRTTMELASSVHHAVEAARPAYQNKSHELIVKLPPQPIYLDGDPVRVAQIVGNLLNNAAKFTEPGGRITLSVERQDNHAVIRVQDNGIGISSEQLPHIFEMFAQADTSLGRAESGVGIGLALVRSLSEMHGGSVQVKSEGLGQGSEFEVRLPAIESPDAQGVIAHAAAAEPIAVPRRRVLVVDDNRESAESLATLLELDGHEIRTAADGNAALSQATAWRPDVVLLDIGLPGLNGYEVARAIRKQPWGKRIGLVALTGWGQDDDRKKSSDAGFDDHLVKPANHASIVKVLARFGDGVSGVSS